MSRPLRIEFPGAFYHVMSRGNGRQWIYKTDADLDLFLRCLRDVIGRYHVRLHAAVLMRNHYHLLVETPEGNLSAMMRRFNSAFAVRMNRRTERKGSVFKPRYHAVLIEEDRYYQTVLRYICQNPVRAGLVKRAEDYAGGSLAWFHDPDRRDVIAWDALLLDTPKNLRPYERLVRLVRGDLEPSPYEESRFPSLLGSEEWVRRTLRDHLEEGDERGVVGEKQYRSIRMTLTPEEIFQAVSASSLPLALRKGAALYLVYQYMAIPVKDLMERFGYRSYFAVTQAMYRFRKRMKTTPSLRQEIDAIRRRLER